MIVHSYLTPCLRKNRRKMLFFISYLILIHLAGSFVAFDTTSENYTVPVSGKCVLTCYVAEVRSFKVSHRSYRLSLSSIAIGSVRQT